VVKNVIESVVSKFLGLNGLERIVDLFQLLVEQVTTIPGLDHLVRRGIREFEVVVERLDEGGHAAAKVGLRRGQAVVEQQRFLSNSAGFTDIEAKLAGQAGRLRGD
jgi:hypothetical protein